MRRETVRLLGEEAGREWYAKNQRYPSREERFELDARAAREVMGDRDPIRAKRHDRKAMRAWLNGFDDGLDEARNPRGETLEDRVTRLEEEVASLLKVG